ncbi:MAG: metal-dependent transcriptional regulator [Saprospiraceae bacterium]|nr:metal-dependent transcriptional regulator [Saprospiraceae bacterium]
MASQTVENYLKAMFALEDEHGNISSVELSSTLGVSKPTTNSMVKKLSEQGLVRYKRYKPIQLTEEGKKAAALIIRKHRLTEMFLVKHMGFGWEDVHVIAEQVEHVKSKAFFDRMDELMGFPHLDPHGSPIPDREGKVQNLYSKALSECTVGQRVKLVGLAQSSSELLEFLTRRGLVLGVGMEIICREEFDRSITIKVAEETQLISEKVSKCLLVV